MTAILNPRSSIDYRFPMLAYERAPYLRAATDEMIRWHKMNAVDQQTFREISATIPEGKDFRWVARTPLSAMSTLLRQRPNIIQDKKAFFDWLKENPQYEVPKSRSRSI